MKHRISFEPDAIIVTIGHSGSGKTSFINSHFDDHRVVSFNETTRYLLGHYDFENYYKKEVSQIVYTTIDVRASLGLFTVVDSIGSAPLLKHIETIARKHDRPLYALIFPHLTDEELTKDYLGWRYDYLDIIQEQIQNINETSLPERYYYFIIGKKERSNFELRIKSEEMNELNPNYNWIVVPDIHGHYSVIQNVYKNKSSDEKILFLGDLGDRGPSSYLSFLWIKKLIQKGECIWIKGNHDQKLYKYFNGWLKDENRLYDIQNYNKKDIPTYGIKIIYRDGGFEKTLREFFNLSPSAMEKYAREFVELYDEHPSVRYYAYLKRGDVIHFFSHANVTNNVIRQRSLSENDRNVCLNHKLSFHYKNKIQALLKVSHYHKIVIHLGHDVITPGKIDHLQVQLEEDSTQVITIKKHDQGIGKYDTPFHELEPFQII